MDAFKPENISTDSDNVPSDLLDTDLTALAQDEIPSLDAMLDDSSDPQSLEEEFADVTQQSAGNLADFDMSVPESESDVDLDEEFAAFQMLQPSDNDEAQSSAPLGLDNHAPEIDELLLDEAFEVETTARDQAAGANPFEIVPAQDSGTPETADAMSDTSSESELPLFAVEALLGEESTAVEENEPETVSENEAISADSEDLDAMPVLESISVEVGEDVSENAQSPLLEDTSGLEDLVDANPDAAQPLISESPEEDLCADDEPDILAELDSEMAVLAELSSEDDKSDMVDDQSPLLEEISELEDLVAATHDKQPLASESQEDKLTELLSDQDNEVPEVVLDLEMDSEPDLIAAPLMDKPIRDDESELATDMEETVTPESSFEPMDLLHDVQDLEMSSELQSTAGIGLSEDLSMVEEPMSLDENSEPDLSLESEIDADTESFSELEISAVDAETDAEQSLDSLGMEDAAFGMPHEHEPDVDLSLELELDSDLTEQASDDFAGDEASLAIVDQQDTDGEISLELELDSDPDLVPASAWDSASDASELENYDTEAALDEALDLEELSMSDDASENAIASDSDDVAMLDDVVTEEVTDDMADFAQSDARVLELESVVQQNQVQLEELQALVNSKIDPEIHAHLLQELRQYKTQSSELETSLQALQAEQVEAQSSVSEADYASLQQLADEQTQTIARLEQELNDWHSQAESQVDPSEIEALSSQSTAQTELIAKLENEIQTLTADYEKSQAEAAQKVELTEYQSVQSEVQQLTTQIQYWEQRYEALSQELDEQKQLTHTAVDPETHASLNQSLQEYREQVHALQSEKAELQEAIETWQGKADGKVDRAEYEAVLEQLQRLKEKNARNFWARLMDWFMGR